MAKGLNRIERFMGLRRLWVVWTYAIRPGWEVTDEAETRTEARWLRGELIEDDGYPKSWVRHALEVLRQAYPVNLQLFDAGIRPDAQS